MKETIDKMLEIGFLKSFTSGFVSNSEEVPHTEVVYVFRRFDGMVFEISLADIERVGLNGFKWILLTQVGIEEDGSDWFTCYGNPAWEWGYWDSEWEDALNE